MSQPPLRALLFDFDGLIVDTEWPIYEAWRQIFEDHGHSLPLETFNQCIGTDFNTWSPKTHLEDLTGNAIDWHSLDETRQAGIEKNLEGAPAMPGISEAVAAAKGGEIQFRVEKAGIIHAGVGKLSFSETQLVENLRAFLDAINKAKPSGSKGSYLRRVSLSSTMGPGLKVSVSSLGG